MRDEDKILKAHMQLPHSGGLRLEQAHPQRDWMSSMSIPAPGIEPSPGKGFANRCLPMLMSNQLGWNVVTNYSYVITNLPDERFIFLWTDEKGPPPWAQPQNNFGHNIVTWALPWVFETPPDWNLLVIPPPNTALSTGVTCLQGLVETDTAVESFTLNWKVEPGISVFVEAGDVIATLVPFPTALYDGFRLVEDTEKVQGYDEWGKARAEGNNPYNVDEFGKWQKGYWNRAKRRKLKRAND